MKVDSTITKLNIADDVDLPTYTQIYQDTLRTNLSAALNTQTHLTTDTSSTGFAGLGEYYSRMSGMIDQQNQAMQVQASILKPALPENFTTSTIGTTFNRAYQYIGGYNAVASLDFAAQHSNPTSDESRLIHEFKTQADASLPHGCNGANDTVSNGKEILAQVIDATGCESSALARMKNTGDYLSVVGMLGIGIAAVAQTAASIPVLGAGIKVFADMFLTLMQILTFFALMLSTYLPLLPYIAWLGALASWLTVVIEGVVAAPLWAFAHLDTEGEGMGNRAEKGYTFLLNVLLRPVLMVVGFLACAILIDVLGKFFFLTYSSAVANAGAGSFTGLIALIIYVAIFFTTCVMIINASVNLIHVVPDAVLTWITQSSASTGAFSGMTGNFSAAAVGATATGNQMITSSIDKARNSRSSSKPAASSDGFIGTEKARDQRK